MTKSTDLHHAFNHATESPESTSARIRPVARPVSKQQIEELTRKLSRPRIGAEFTPMSSVTTQVRTERDQSILKEIEAMRQRLESRRNAAKEAFHRAHDNRTIRRGMRR